MSVTMPIEEVKTGLLTMNEKLQPGRIQGFLVTICHSVQISGGLIQQLALILEKCSADNSDSSSLFPRIQDNIGSVVSSTTQKTDENKAIESQLALDSITDCEPFDYMSSIAVYNEAESLYYESLQLIQPEILPTSSPGLRVLNKELPSNASPSLATTSVATSSAAKKKRFADLARLRGKTFMMAKPQKKFSPPIVNDHKEFVPILSSKPNSKGPWKLNKITDPTTGKISYEHPYKIEIEAWSPTELMTIKTYPVTAVKSLDDTSFVYVQTYDQLKLLIQDLSKVTEFGFDVEHSDRSFFGLTCLIQISTRFMDYIVDCFTLRNHLHTLNTVFTQPKILKIAHSAKSDVKNLQRDFGIYIVGLFDTSEVVKIVNMNNTNVGLGALLLEYLNVDVDKSLQLADWRIRPIPRDMMKYARSDSHYLMKLYDLLKEKLLQDGSPELLLQAYENSKEVCLLQYERPTKDRLYSWKFARLNNQQMYALTELDSWRDAVARREDDGIEFVASTKLIKALAEKLPTNEKEILSIVKTNGGWRVPKLLEQDIKKIVKILKVAKSNVPLTRKQTNVKKQSEYKQCFQTDIDNILFFPVKSPQVNPVKVVQKINENLIMDNASSSFPITNVQEIMPVSVVCENDLSMIYLELDSLLRKESDEENCTFSIFNNFDRHQESELLHCIKTLVKEIRPSWTFEQYSTDFCILALLVGNLCCLSILGR